MVVHCLGAVQSIQSHKMLVLNLDFSSTHIVVNALDHTLTPFCFICRQFFGFFPATTFFRCCLMMSVQFFVGRLSWLSLSFHHILVKLFLCPLKNVSTGLKYFCNGGARQMYSVPL